MDFKLRKLFFLLFIVNSLGVILLWVFWPGFDADDVTQFYGIYVPTQLLTWVCLVPWLKYRQMRTVTRAIKQSVERSFGESSGASEG